MKFNIQEEILTSFKKMMKLKNNTETFKIDIFGKIFLEILESKNFKISILSLEVKI